MLMGDKLVAAKVITAEQLQKALEEQKKTGAKLGEVIIALGFASSAQIEQALV